MNASAELWVTFFPDYAAQQKREAQVTLDALAGSIAAATAPGKDKLPWLKLARFGNKKTAKGSLRHDGNVEAISGVEADYDGEIVAFEEAVEIAEKAGLLAIIYTSPSNTPEHPRWRILCPTSRELIPGERLHMVGRVAGLYRGIFAAESWTLSQAFYFGSVNGNPDHRVEIIEGQPIDELDELDEIALDKPHSKPNGAGAHQPSAGLVDEDELFDAIKTGVAYHSPAMRLLGHWALAGVPMLEARDRLVEAFECVLPADRDQRWRHRVDSIPDMLAYIWPKEGAKRVEQTNRQGIALSDFYAYMPQHNYIYTPSREMWPGSSINARIPPIPIGGGMVISASLWLDQNKPVEQMTWAPGLPMVISDRLISQGGWIKQSNVSCFNLYRPPTIEHGDPRQAGLWIEHGRRIFPDDIDHIIRWLAHRVQRPEDKINHALVLGGPQGIGKDTLLEPVKRAVGAWNFSEISPQQMLGRFNGFAKSVILRLSEARDLGEVDRYQFYEHLKAYTAAPPDVLRVDEKNLREYNILNCCGVIITTNYKTDGIYLPADDRRHFVAWSSITSKDDFENGYWGDLYRWYEHRGAEHVAAYLASVDLSHFDAKAPPPKTLAFWEIVDASRAPEDAELADVIDRMDYPETLTLSQAAGYATAEFADWLLDRKNARRVPHRLEACGYVAVRNGGAKDGLWKVDGKRQAIYAKASLSLRDRADAAMRRAGAR